MGYYLARVLVSGGHEVLVLEKKPRRTEFVAEELGEVIVQGDGCEARILEEVGSGRADMLIAVTGDEEDNLVACQVAKHKFNVPRTIARSKNPWHRLLTPFAQIAGRSGLRSGIKWQYGLRGSPGGEFPGGEHQRDL